jgi:hypothetical protein
MTFGSVTTDELTVEKASRYFTLRQERSDIMNATTELQLKIKEISE